MSAGKEPSHALPVGMYRDLSEFVRFPSETSCDGCRHELHMAGIVSCLRGRRHSNNGGRKCGLFKVLEGAK